MVLPFLRFWPAMPVPGESLQTAGDHRSAVSLLQKQLMVFWVSQVFPQELACQFKQLC